MHGYRLNMIVYSLHVIVCNLHTITCRLYMIIMQAALHMIIGRLERCQMDDKTTCIESHAGCT